ncbi:MAG: hypothetical protein WAX66_01955 [Patescibacteria group bacterium]
MSKKTGNTVQDDKLTNEKLGALYRKVSEIVRRLNKGTIEYASVMLSLQKIIEGKWGWLVCRTIKIGTHRDGKSLLKSLKELGAWMIEGDDGVFNEIKLSKFKQSLDLMVASVEELGYPQGTTTENIFKAGIEQGGDLCPAEAASYYILQHGNDLKPGDSLSFATESIKNSDGAFYLFHVKKLCGVYWLSAFYSKPTHFWGASNRFVFVCRKEKAL